jgi:hypothetical protein
MLNEKRRRAIVKVLNRVGRVLFTAPSRQFKTSQVTIRKDLDMLYSQGSHGGALLSEGVLEDFTQREKEKLHHKEKLRIDAAGAEMVKEARLSYSTQEQPRNGQAHRRSLRFEQIRAACLTLPTFRSARSDYRPPNSERRFTCSARCGDRSEVGLK